MNEHAQIGQDTAGALKALRPARMIFFCFSRKLILVELLGEIKPRASATPRTALGALGATGAIAKDSKGSDLSKKKTLYSGKDLEDGYLRTSKHR